MRRSTQQRLAEEARLEGMSVIEMVDAAVDLWEERRLLDSMDESYRKHGDEIHEEMRDWLDAPLDRPPDAG
ncbi:MAG TPA: hypothetical protein VFM94_03010 [Solirubrobacterales bacterium]|nr:hypothetical protein [Solirubrobacterales bacterium]